MSNGTPITTDLLNLGISSHNNHYLFSDHFLNHMLKKSRTWEPYWKGAADPSAEFLTAVTALYHAEKHALASYSESQLEDNWYKKIFALLGHSFEGQAKVSKLQGTGVRYPDFAFFADEASRVTAAPHQTNSNLYFQHAVAVGEVKKWDIPLGKKLKGGEPNFDNNNPSFQIDYYLRATGLTWGILSNGRLWRLVHKETSYKLDVYFELDLVKAIEEQNYAAVRFFYLFFRSASFLPDTSGRTFLDAALQASRDYAQQLEADLRDNAYKALEQLIQGFMEPKANQLTAEQLPEIYTHSLYLLYRIIFLLYGESRGLLPLENKHYQTVSLTKLARDIAKELDRSTPFLANSFMYWLQLKHLFTIMSGEEEALNKEMDVPRYNGGLFNPHLHPFLERYVVGDKFLVAAIDVLARRDSAESQAINPRETVDYRDLGVRQIGSIYEGLLEYQPRRAAEPMLAIKKSKGEQWVALAEKPKTAKPLATRQTGDIYLETDKGERKATGSYYTPEYIVKYIVEQTLGPLVEEARARVAQTGKGHDHAQQFAAEILRLRVLDPAMGSGHFLVEAADFLARAIATDEFVQAGELAPLQDDDVVFWRRQVVERCIYGVDKNRMAVELAKLSLWLVTVARDKPLSFLDHHLRHGDSLVGARLADLASLPTAVAKQVSPAPAQQAQLFDETALARDLHLAVGGMQTIGRMLSETIEDIHTKEQIFADLRQTHMAKWRRVADLWVSSFFGNGMSQEAWPLLVDYIQRGGETNHDVRLLLPHLERVQENDYFHWELEFPEIFFDEYGRGLGDKAGFNAVIGNPPYEELSQEERGEEIFEIKLFDNLEHFKPALGNRINLYRLFITQSLFILRNNGRHGFIVPMSLLADQFTLSLRKYLLRNFSIETLELFPQKDDPHDRIFFDAKLSTCLYVLKKELPFQNITFVRTHSGRQINQTSPNYTTPQSAFFDFDNDNCSIPGIGTETWQLVLQLSQLTKLGAYAKALPGELMINKSIQPYLTSKEKGEEIIRGSHVAMYQLVRPKQGDNLYLNRQKYLEDHQNSLKAFHHREERIIYQRYAAIDNYRRLIATNLVAGHFCSHTVGYFANIKEVSRYFLLALMNSKLLDWRFNLTSTNNNINGYEVEALPCPKLKFATPQEERTAAVAHACDLYKTNYAAVLEWTEAELAQNRNDTIHDLLAFLAEQMMALNGQKQAQIEAFWLDMEGVTDEKTLAAVRTKGKWEEAVYEQVAAARPFVRPTSRSTISLDQTLAWNEEAFKGVAKMLVKNIPSFAQWVQIYRTHHAAVAPLAQRLQATDALIDQIVYRLYGLTAGEIALVEGGAIIVP